MKRKLLSLLLVVAACFTATNIYAQSDEYTTVDQLVANKFYLVNGSAMAQFGESGIDMTTGISAVVVNNDNAYRYFQAEPVTVEGEEYWYLHACKKNGEAMMGWWGAGREKNDCVNVSMWWGNFEMAQGADHETESGKLYGGAYELGALFKIDYVEGKGFSFKNMASIEGNNKYINGSCKQDNNVFYWRCYDPSSARFDVSLPDDYKELNISDLTTVGTATVSGEVIDMTNGGGAKWEFAEPQNWSAYQYLVIVPKRRFTSTDQLAAGLNGEETDVRTKINGVEKKWIGYWNPKRACVYNLTEVEGTDAISSLSIEMGNGTRGEWSISAVYLTNKKPTYAEELYNHNAPLGEAETTADHVRTLSALNTYGAVCLPYASAICGADAYEFVGVDDKDNPSAIWVKPVTGLLEAGVPYIFKTNTNLNVTFYRAGANEVATPATNNGLVGVFADETVAEGCYAVVGGKFQTSTAGVAVKANRAYIDIENAPVIPAAEAKIRGLVNVDADEATAIKSMEQNSTINGAIYDLNGRRVVNPTTGLYIKNGKKYFVK